MSQQYFLSAATHYNQIQVSLIQMHIELSGPTLIHVHT